MIHLTFKPTENGKYSVAHVEVDGVDLSNRTVSCSFVCGGWNDGKLTLNLVLRPGDIVDLEVPDEDLIVNATLIQPTGDVVEVTAVGDKARRYVDAAARA